MVGRFLKVSLATLSLVSFVSVVKAQDSAEVKDIKVGAEYRAGLVYDNNKVQKTETNDPKASTYLNLEHARFHINATLPKEVKAKVTYDVLTNSLKYAYATWTYANMLDLSFGKMKVKEGGYAVRGDSYNIVAPITRYEEYMPFDLYSDMVQAKFMMSPVEVTLQILNDLKKVSDDSDNSDQNDWRSGLKNEEDKLTMALEIVADVQFVKPLIQFGMYDNNKSSYFVLGLASEISGLGLELDYINDTRKLADEKYTFSGLNFKAKYALSGFTPWLEVHQFNVKQPETDLKANSHSVTSFAKVDDNAMSYSIGATCDVFGAHYVPYLAIINETGSFYKNDTSDDKETRTNMQVKFGVYGKF